MTGFCFTKQIFALLTVLIVLGFAVVYQGVAEEKSSTLSGRVIGTKGEPIAETSIALLYVKVAENGEMDTLYDRSLYPFLRQNPAHFPQELSGRPPPMKRNTKRVHPF